MATTFPTKLFMSVDFPTPVLPVKRMWTDLVEKIFSKVSIGRENLEANSSNAIPSFCSYMYMK